jgi:hypothetical protein
LQITSWFTSKSCARADTSIASAQMPAGKGDEREREK